MEEWWVLMEERGTRRDFPMKPQVVAWELGQRLRDDAIVSCDSGTIATWWARQISARRGQMHSVRELLDQDLLPWLPGQDPRRITSLLEHLTKAIHALTPGCLSSTALAAIDIALWDLAGKGTGTPLAVLLGGARDRFPSTTPTSGGSTARSTR